MIRRREDMVVKNNVNMRGGDGTIIMRELVTRDELMGNGRLFALMTIEPGCSIGLHVHEHEAEYFYVVKGNLIADDNGEEKKLNAGDVLITSNGQSHSVKNNGSYTAELVAVILNGDQVIQ